jgi:glycosyltransferase involved in cell wall biosynthesis
MPAGTVCLNMIVRDEAPVIARCLDSVRPFVDRWVVVDTGSVDGTRALVARHLESIPGALHERPWRDFAHNRNEALSLARDQADYLFFIDADETLCLPEGYRRPALTADGYHLRCDYAGASYLRCALVATRLPWRWSGAVHECLVTDVPHALATLEGPSVLVRHDGARSRDPDTYRKDARLLEAALAQDPRDTRAAFYLAQTYRDMGDLPRSIAAYRARAAMGGWEEEVWFSLYQIARLEERRGASPAQIAEAYLAAYAFRPTRAEPLVELARFHRTRGEFALAHLYAARAAAISRPADLLFVEDDAYRWRALDELAISAFYVGQHAEGRSAMLRLWSEAQFPASERERLRRNCAYYGIATD